MNQPLVIAGIGVVVVAAAITLNYALWQEEVDDTPRAEPAAAAQVANGKSRQPAPSKQQAWVEQLVQSLPSP